MPALASLRPGAVLGQEADLRRLLDLLPVAGLSIDRSGIGMNLAENLAGRRRGVHERRQGAVGDGLQVLPRQRELVSQVHAIKRRVLPSGKVSFDAERTERGHADRFWAIALACQKERGPAPSRAPEIGVRVIG